MPGVNVTKAVERVANRMRADVHKIASAAATLTAEPGRLRPVTEANARKIADLETFFRTFKRQVLDSPPRPTVAASPTHELVSKIKAARTLDERLRLVDEFTTDVRQGF